jgi:hypothetical protein
METIKLFQTKLGDKTVAYSSATVFCVQVGKGSKGSYKTRYSFTGELERAVLYFNAINIGNGYKKRLTMAGKVLGRVSS